MTKRKVCWVGATTHMTDATSSQHCALRQANNDTQELTFCVCSSLYVGEDMIACEHEGGCSHQFANGWFHPKCMCQPHKSRICEIQVQPRIILAMSCLSK